MPPDGSPSGISQDDIARGAWTQSNGGGKSGLRGSFAADSYTGMYSWAGGGGNTGRGAGLTTGPADSYTGMYSRAGGNGNTGGVAGLTTGPARGPAPSPTRLPAAEASLSQFSFEDSPAGDGSSTLSLDRSPIGWHAARFTPGGSSQKAPGAACVLKKDGVVRAMRAALLAADLTGGGVTSPAAMSLLCRMHGMTNQPTQIRALLQVRWAFQN